MGLLLGRHALWDRQAFIFGLQQAGVGERYREGRSQNLCEGIDKTLSTQHLTHTAEHSRSNQLGTNRAGQPMAYSDWYKGFRTPAGHLYRYQAQGQQLLASQ